MMGFGSIIGSGDMNAATHIGQVCDAYGLDTVSTSNVIGLAYLMFDRGLLTKRDTGGLRLAWGDPASAEQLVHWIARGQGVGALMGRGAKAFAAHFGSEDLAAEVNNLEMPYHDPRAFSGMAIVYVTSPRGACHNQSDFFLAEVGASQEDIGIPVLNPPTPDDGKARLVALHQDYRSVTNSLGICIFARVPASRQLEMYNAATGKDWDIDTLMRAGARIWNLKRVLNHCLGLTRANDRLPKLLLEPLPTGLSAGQALDFQRLMQDYYAVRGWDPVTGRPLRPTLERLGLAFAADALDGVPA
jgi:aldehyde:ferredoxin oxidoreductase